MSRRPLNSAATKAAIAAVMTKHSIMSGIGARASVKMPCVVNTMNPAASPISLLQSRQPIHEVAIRTPTAATRDGQSALDCVTAPPGHAASAVARRHREPGLIVRRQDAGAEIEEEEENTDGQEHRGASVTCETSAPSTINLGAGGGGHTVSDRVEDCGPRHSHSKRR